MSYILDALTKAAQQRERQVPVVQRLLSAAPANGASWARVPGRLAPVLAVSALIVVLAMGIPWLSATVIDRVVPTKDTALHDALGLLVVAAAFGYALCAAGRAALLMRFQQRFDRELLARVVERLLRLPFTYFQRRATGDLLAPIVAHGLYDFVALAAIVKLHDAAPTSAHRTL